MTTWAYEKRLPEKFADFLYRNGVARSDIESACVSKAKQIGSPDVVWIDVFSDTGPIGRVIVAPENGEWTRFEKHPRYMIRTSPDVKVPEDAVIQTAVHDDPFAY